jgi:DNA-binding PadR family transcriptional regulator
MMSSLKDVEKSLLKGMLDLVVLDYLHVEPMHGYQLITTIRQDFHVYFGASTVYPLLSALEAKKYIASRWDLSNDRPKKVYTLTPEGDKLRDFTERSLNQIVQKLTRNSLIEVRA